MKIIQGLRSVRVGSVLLVGLFLCGVAVAADPSGSGHSAKKGKTAQVTDAATAKAVAEANAPLKPAEKKAAQVAADHRIQELRSSTEETLKQKQKELTPEAFKTLRRELLKTRSLLERQILEEEQQKVLLARIKAKKSN